jgi:hypothetical protein
MLLERNRRNQNNERPKLTEQGQGASMAVVTRDGASAPGSRIMIGEDIAVYSSGDAIGAASGADIQKPSAPQGSGYCFQFLSCTIDVGCRLKVFKVRLKGGQ